MVKLSNSAKNIPQFARFHSIPPINSRYIPSKLRATASPYCWRIIFYDNFQVSIHEVTGNAASKYLLVMKGAAEKISAICSTILVKESELPLDDNWKKRIDDAYLSLGGLGERVIG